MDIKLRNNGGKSWRQIDDSFIKGFAFVSDTLLDEPEIYNSLIESIKTNTLDKKLTEFNGNFSAVLKLNDKIYLISDKYKTYPLLYTMNNHSLFVTDEAKEILDNISNLEFSKPAILTYLSCGYLHSDLTYFEGVKIVMSGSYVVLDTTNNNISAHNYHKHIFEGIKTENSEEQIIIEAVEVMDRAFLRVLKSIGDRPIIIPLSGGYDSRLVACLCKKFNVKNVSCFTYGRESSHEVEVSKKVANTLGFKWHFVEYTSETNSQLIDDEEYNRYQIFACNLNTTPHYQDFFAFRELRRKGIVPNNAIIMPGHSGDTLGGGFVPFGELDKKKSVATLLFDKSFTWNKLKRSNEKCVREVLGKELDRVIARENKDLACDLFHNRDIQSRQSNFIMNWVRCYEFFGVDWRIPLWDCELSDFWLSISWDKKTNNILYTKYIFEGYFKPFNVDFYKPSETKSSIALMTKIKLPFGLKSRIKYVLSTNVSFFKKYHDFNNFSYFIAKYKQEISPEFKKLLSYYSYYTNAMFALYFISKIKKIIK